MPRNIGISGKTIGNHRKTIGKPKSFRGILWKRMGMPEDPEEYPGKP